MINYVEINFFNNDKKFWFEILISFKIDYLKFLVSKDRFRIFILIKSGNNVFKTGDFYFGDFSIWSFYWACWLFDKLFVFLWGSFVFRVLKFVISYYLSAKWKMLEKCIQSIILIKDNYTNLYYLLTNCYCSC